MTLVIKPSEIDVLVNSIKKGEIVAFPTETVYGVACQFNDVDALERLMEAKNRDASKAVTLMLSNINDIEKYAYIDEKVMKVAQAFMPGRITLILKRKESVNPLMTNNLESIGIRIPDSEFVLDLINRAGPLLVTSANISGGSNTTTHQEVLKQLEGRISLVVEGHTSSAIASTVVDLRDGVKILREGMISKEEIKGVLK